MLGIDFFVGLPSDKTIAAHVVGFDWLHGEPDSVEVRFRVTDRGSDGAVDDQVHAVVESYLLVKGPISFGVEEIGPNTYVVIVWLVVATLILAPMRRAFLRR